MLWEQPDRSTIVMECDTCGDVTECDVETVREGEAHAPADSDFIACWRYLQGLGWKSFKRTGKSWTYHCPKCADAAEQAQTEYRRDERERERAKARNADA